MNLTYFCFYCIDRAQIFYYFIYYYSFYLNYIHMLIFKVSYEDQQKMELELSQREQEIVDLQKAISDLQVKSCFEKLHLHVFL